MNDFQIEKIEQNKKRYCVPLPLEHLPCPPQLSPSWTISMWQGFASSLNMPWVIAPPFSDVGWHPQHEKEQWHHLPPHSPSLKPEHPPYPSKLPWNFMSCRFCPPNMSPACVCFLQLSLGVAVCPRPPAFLSEPLVWREVSLCPKCLHLHSTKPPQWFTDTPPPGPTFLPDKGSSSSRCSAQHL